jgi:hypothetical protein
LHEETLSFVFFTAESKFCSFLFSGFDVTFDLFFLCQVDLRTLISFLVELFTNLDIFGTVDCCFHKFVINSRLNEGSASGNTALASI